MANATSGGFFPNGVNGLLNMSSGAETSAGSILSASPNPIPVATGGLGSTTITYNAPGIKYTQLRLNSPNGLLLQNGSGSGSFVTGPYLPDGSVVYLQDASQGNPQSSANTLATLVIHLKSM